MQVCAVAGAIGTEQYFRTTADAVYYQTIIEDFVASIYWLIAIVIAELSRRLELRVGAVQVESINHNPIAERYLSLVARRA